jgi:formylglycine-generating enzyme required for sulfatase activity
VRKFAAMFTLLLPLVLSGSGAFAESMPQDSSPQDDDLGVSEELKKEGEKKKVIKKEDLPPIDMIYVKGGCFMMGDQTGEGDEDERPAHEVCLNDYYIANTEVTQELFEKVMGYIPAWKYNPTMPRDPKSPVNYVSWSIVQEFIGKLNEITKGYYRLPTEAEWEYASRSGGKDQLWSGTNNEAEIGNYAWYEDNTDNMIMPIKGKKPNALGLYDMSGNVWEWVEDYFDFEYYQVSPKSNPFGADYSLFRVVRGGSVFDPPNKLRTAYRYGLEHNRRNLNVGFRLAE